MSQLGIQMAEDSRGTRSRRHTKRRQRRRRRKSFVALVLVLAVVGAVGAGIFFGGQAIIDRGRELFGAPADYPGPGTGEVIVEIPPGATLTDMGQILQDAGVVASAKAFVNASNDNSRSGQIQPGSYTLMSEMKAADVILAMLQATEVVGKVAVPEGLRESLTVARIAEEGGFDPAAVQAAIDAASLPPYAEGDAEGFLFPATYDLTPDSDPTSVVANMMDRFGTASETVGLEAGAAARRLTPRQVVTIASIVQREVRNVSDMPMVAEVIYNRLAAKCGAVIGTRLQMDSTVHYATNDYSSVFTSDAARATNSPYNTYVVGGLPPGPIASPGEAALAAALNPSNAGYCYFAAVNLETGETKFATTDAEHAANVAQLQAYCRESDLC